MKTVSFQGTQLSAADRRKLEMQRRPFLNDHLNAQVQTALDETEQRKAQGVKAPRLWAVIMSERGTPYCGDFFKFN